MAERNPYAPPKAPVVQAEYPSKVYAEEAEIVYGGFWRRVGAGLLDGLILAPLGVLTLYGLQNSRMFYVYYFVPNLLLTWIYYVYLVKRYGGTPGKRIANMRIQKIDGSPVTLWAATARYSVMLVFTVFSGLSLVIATLGISEAAFASSGFLEKMQLIDANSPSWNKPLTYLMYGWWIAVAISLAANVKKRALHDFIAGTMVVRTD